MNTLDNQCSSIKQIYFGEQYQSRNSTDKIISLKINMPNFLNSRLQHYRTFIFDHNNVLGNSEEFLIKQVSLDIPVIGNDMDTESIFPDTMHKNSLQTPKSHAQIISLNSGIDYRVYYDLDKDNCSYNLSNDTLNISAHHNYCGCNNKLDIFKDTSLMVNITVNISNFEFYGESDLFGYKYLWQEKSSEKFPNTMSAFEIKLSKNTTNLLELNC